VGRREERHNFLGIESIILTESSAASPCPSDKGGMKIKLLEWLEIVA
jgi:hypothetical protein